MCGPFVMACAAEGDARGHQGTKRQQPVKAVGRPSIDAIRQIQWRHPRRELAVITKDISYRPGLG